MDNLVKRLKDRNEGFKDDSKPAHQGTNIINGPVVPMTNPIEYTLYILLEYVGLYTGT